MKPKIVVGIMSITLMATALTACGSSAKLTEVSGIGYSDGVISYAEVAAAEGYNVSFIHAGEVAYVGGLDDAGQGVYINYLCPVAGTFAFDAYYCMDEVGGFKTAHNDVWVNGEYQTRLDFTELTGWGGDKFNAAKTTAEITLKKGWNTISVMKNGDASDNWGGFAELDYFVINGNGDKYNADDLVQYGVSPSAYRLEAEMGSPRRKNPENNLYECKNPAIAGGGEFTYSNNFLLGNIESNYDGVE